MVRFIHETLVSTHRDTKITPRVLALGLPRCATSSLQAALETLSSAPCMHMAHVQPSTELQHLVTEAILEKQDVHKRHKILSRLLSGFAATADFPSILFADDLMDMYPDAAIILNTRSGGASSWHRSFSEGLRFFDSYLFRCTTCLVKSDRAMMRMMQATDDLYLERWRLTFRDEEIYDRHNEWVRAEARKRGREVLEFTAEDGWEPLCKFLGRPIPSTPYPRMNDQRTMKMVKRFIILRGAAHWVVLLMMLWVVIRVCRMLPPNTMSLVKIHEVWVPSI